MERTLKEEAVLHDYILSIPDNTPIRATFRNLDNEVLIVTGQLSLTEWDERFVNWDTMEGASMGHEDPLPFDLCNKHQVNPYLIRLEVEDVNALPIEFRMTRKEIEELVGRPVGNIAWHNLKMGIEMDPLGLFEGLILSLLEGVEEVIADDDLSEVPRCYGSNHSTRFINGSAPL